MRIALICSPTFPIPPHAGYGGITRGVYELAIGLAEKGDTVYVFCSDSSTIHHPNIVRISYGPVGAYEETMTSENQHEQSEQRKTKSIKNIKTDLAKLIDDKKIDLINLRWDSAVMQNFCQQFKIPLVVSIHTNLDKKFQENFFKDETIYTSLTETHKVALGNRPNIYNSHYGISMRGIVSSTKILFLIV